MGLGEGESAHQQPNTQKAWIDPSHPAAGKGGVVLDPSLRFQPGVSGNPGGRPKGACPRAAFLRKIAEAPNAHGEGALAARMGERMAALLTELETANVPRADLIRAELAELRHSFAEAEGKPQERVELSGGATTRIVHVSDVETGDVALPSEESA